jgi:flagellar biosynthesis protein
MKQKRIQKVVALKYDRASELAPTVVAKGKGKIAEKIIHLARENDIPLHKEPDLATVLGVLELESEIPEELYQAVAEVLVFLYKLNQKPVDLNEITMIHPR